MTAYRLVLASASPRRRQLLEQIGLKPEIMPSMEKEEAMDLPPGKLVEALSKQKAEAVAGRYGQEAVAVAGRCSQKAVAGGCSQEAVVIGADTVVSVEGRILGKPEDERQAREMLGLLQGRVHQVYTGVTIILAGTGKSLTFSERTDVSVYPMDDEEISRYVSGGEPMDKAGAYGIQGAFAAYIREIRGDYFNVVGLPVGRLYQELKALGLEEEHD